MITKHTFFLSGVLLMMLSCALPTDDGVREVPTETKTAALPQTAVAEEVLASLPYYEVYAPPSRGGARKTLVFVPPIEGRYPAPFPISQTDLIQTHTWEEFHQRWPRLDPLDVAGMILALRGEIQDLPDGLLSLEGCGVGPCPAFPSAEPSETPDMPNYTPPPVFTPPAPDTPSFLPSSPATPGGGSFPPGGVWGEGHPLDGSLGTPGRGSSGGRYNNNPNHRVPTPRQGIAVVQPPSFPSPHTLSRGEREEAMQRQLAAERAELRRLADQFQNYLDALLLQADKNTDENREAFKEGIRKSPYCMDFCQRTINTVKSSEHLCELHVLSHGLGWGHLAPGGREVAVLCALWGITLIEAGHQKMSVLELGWCHDVFCEPPSGIGKPPLQDGGAQ